MKKLILTSIILMVLAASLVFAEQGQQSGLEDSDDSIDDTSDDSNDSSDESDDSSDDSDNDSSDDFEDENESEIEDENETEIEFERELSDRGELKIKLKYRDGDVESEFEFEEKVEGNETKLQVKLSNGRNAEIKIMPSTASERALERLRLKVCNESNNCTIQLKEVGSGNETRAAYEVQLERHSRILGIFAAKMHVETEVDAENGEVLRERKPWWAFLATEPAEE